MTYTQTHFPDAILLQHACRGFALTITTAFLEASAELGELHASRFTSTAPQGLLFHRQRLIRVIDAEILAADIPRSQALSETQIRSVGAVVDQIAQCCAVAFRAPFSRVSPEEVDDAYAELELICAEYDALVDEIAAGSAIPPINRHRLHARPLSHLRRTGSPH
ncbi:hypothetical protein ACFWPH_27995 [Nocardia sp. NPDC058499]|uniref:hypothetical protein n=1 Tax=Nocardia sp. NPDC058499 TaxID=3346530 RepID=UPI003650B426